MKRGGRLNNTSTKRKAQSRERVRVRAEVLARGVCEYAQIIPEVACGGLPDRAPLEVDEIRGGSFRVTEWLDPARCKASCAKHHDVKTANKREILRRLEGEPHGPLNL